MIAEISAMAARVPGVTGINEIRTLHRSPSDILAMISLDFRDELRAGDVEKAITGLERAIEDRFPMVRRIFIEAQSAPDHAEMVRRAQREATAG